MISPGCAACARLWLDDGDAFAKLGSMNLADVPDAALQGVAGIRRADFAVVALGVAHLTIKILGIENALRVLDCREESLQEDIEADISTDVLDTRVGNTGVFLPGCKMPSPLRHAVSHRSQFTRDMMRAYSTDFCCQVREPPVFGSSHLPGAALAITKRQKNPANKVPAKVLIAASAYSRRKI